MCHRPKRGGRSIRSRGAIDEAFSRLLKALSSPLMSPRLHLVILTSRRNRIILSFSNLTWLADFTGCQAAEGSYKSGISFKIYQVLWSLSPWQQAKANISTHHINDTYKMKTKSCWMKVMLTPTGTYDGDDICPFLDLVNALIADKTRDSRWTL